MAVDQYNTEVFPGDYVIHKMNFDSKSFLFCSKVQKCIGKNYIYVDLLIKGIVGVVENDPNNSPYFKIQNSEVCSPVKVKNYVKADPATGSSHYDWKQIVGLDYNSFERIYKRV